MKKILIIFLLAISALGYGQNAIDISAEEVVIGNVGGTVIDVGASYYALNLDTISDLTITPAGTSIVLSWTDNSTGEDGYIIQRGSFGGPYVSIDSITGTAFNNTSLSYGTGYTYKILPYKNTTLGPSFKDSTTTWTWPHTMAMNYYSINAPYITYTQAEKDTIEGRLSQGYIVSTFGPSGTNKTACDFFMIFWNSNTTTALTTRTNTKTGATLRWDYGAGNIYSQNNLPANINSGIITVSSTDGFSGWTVMRANANTFINNFPIGSLPAELITLNASGNLLIGDWTNKTMPNTLTALSIDNNLFTGDWSNKTLSAGLNQLLINNNVFTGGLPNISQDATIGLVYNAYINGFTSASSLTTFKKAMSVFRIDLNSLPTAKVDELLHNLNVYYTANAPTVNCTINLSGAAMGIPTGGASNTDLVALQAIWTAAGKTLTITIRTV